MTVQMEAVAQAIVDAAVAETKAWLRIETSGDDAALAGACRSAIGMAEDFCAQYLFTRPGVEILPTSRRWGRMRACPVRLISGVESIGVDGAAMAIGNDGYAIDLDSDGDGWVRVSDANAGGRIRMNIIAGMADDWADLPDPLRQGVVRLSAHLFMQNDNDAPPAIVTALWRPWRRMRLA